MQISVFLTPIFADQVSVGHGVCVQLADVVAVAARAHTDPHASHDQAQHTMQLLHELADPHAHHQPNNPAQNTEKKLITQDHLTPPSTAPPSSQHSMDSAQCGFCLLIGYSVLPPVPENLLESIAFFDLVQSVIVAVAQHPFAALRGLIPQSRAPPIYF